MLEQYKEFITNGSIDFSMNEIHGINLPPDYIEFMKQNNGGEGDIGNTWVILYEKDDLVEYNTDGSLDDDERFEAALLIGGNGGGEWYGIDKEGNYFMTSAIGDADDTVVLGKTLLEFLEGLNDYFSS